MTSWPRTLVALAPVLSACTAAPALDFGKVEVAAAPEVIDPTIRYDRVSYVPLVTSPAAPPMGGRQSTPAERRLAKAAFSSGLRYFNRGSFRAALRYFQRADRYHSTPDSRYRIAKTYDRMGRRREARRAYERFIESRPGSNFTWRLREARRRLRQLKP